MHIKPCLIVNDWHLFSIFQLVWNVVLVIVEIEIAKLRIDLEVGTIQERANDKICDNKCGKSEKKRQLEDGRRSCDYNEKNK